MFRRMFIIHVSWCSHKSSLECLCITHGLCSCPLCVTIATLDHNVSPTPVFYLTGPQSSMAADVPIGLL